MSNIVNINGKNFINDYIDFTQRHCRKHCDRRNFATSQCLVHVWQNSNDLLDFWDNMVSVHNHWVKDSSVDELCKHPLNAKGYIDQINGLRHYGVKLKPYENENTTVETAAEVRELNKIAAITVT